MIHVKEDKRSRNSANLLMDGLVRCLEMKDFSKISISDLQKASGVSRATFYRLFDNIEDVLAYKCQQLAHDLMETYRENGKDAEQNFLLYALRYWIDNSMYIQALFKCNRPDIFADALISNIEKSNFTFGGYTYYADNDSEEIRIRREYILSAVVGSLGWTLMRWIKNGRKETPEELYEIFISFGKFMDNLNKE